MIMIIAIAVGLGFLLPVAQSSDAAAASKKIEDICFEEVSKRSFNCRGGRVEPFTTIAATRAGHPEIDLVLYYGEDFKKTYPSPFPAR